MHDFIINYNNKNRDFGYKLIVDFYYQEYLQPLYKGLPCLSEKIVINKERKLAYTFYNRRNYRCYII